MVYKYYDTPKGEDIFKKLWITTKYAGTAGIIVSTVDVMYYSHPKSYVHTLGRYLYFTGPFIATAAAFTVTANLLTSLRKKDDRLNYFLGGVAAGTVVGTWRKSFMVGFLSSLAFGVMGIVKKDSIDQGWSFLPPLKVCKSNVNTRQYDFTLTKERPRNWVTSEK